MPILNENNPYEVEKYERFVESSPHGHMMQSVNWAKVKSNWDKDYIYLEDEAGNIRAAMSILSIKNDEIHSFLYASRGPVCDFYDLDTVKALLAEAEPVIQARQAFLLRMDPEVIYDPDLVQSYQDLGLTVRTRGEAEKSFSNPRNNMMMNLAGKDKDEVNAFLTSKRRNSIRKTYKNGLVTSQFMAGDPGYNRALDTFFELTKIMAERQKITHRPKSYFDRLLHAFPDARIFETKDDGGEVLASGIVVTYNRKSFYIYGASSNNKRNLKAPNQLNYEAIQYAVSRGAEEYDFGGVFDFDTSDGLYAFKKGFCKKEGLREFIGEIDYVLDEALYRDFMKTQ